MNAPTADDLREAYARWPTERLVRATTVEFADYQPMALELMRAELEARGLSAEERAAAVAVVGEEIQEEKAVLCGVRGFLLFFVIVLAFNVLMMAVLSLDSLANSGGNPLVLAASLSNLALAGYGAVVFALLLRRSPQAPRLTRWWLGACALLAALVSVIALVAGGSTIAPPTAIVACAIWYAYFNSSKRVAATYGTSSH